jgi:hypothetical protein
MAKLQHNGLVLDEAVCTIDGIRYFPNKISSSEGQSLTTQNAIGAEIVTKSSSKEKTLSFEFTNTEENFLRLSTLAKKTNAFSIGLFWKGADNVRRTVIWNGCRIDGNNMDFSSGENSGVSISMKYADTDSSQ